MKTNVTGFELARSAIEIIKLGEKLPSGRSYSKSLDVAAIAARANMRFRQMGIPVVPPGGADNFGNVIASAVIGVVPLAIPFGDSIVGNIRFTSEANAKKYGAAFFFGSGIGNVNSDGEIYDFELMYVTAILS